MKSNASIQLNPPQVVDYGPIRLIGLNKRYSDETSAGIPNQWEVFSKLGLEHDADVSGDTFGVLHNADEDGNVDYFCGLEVLSYSDTPDGAGRLTVPAQTYAVFSYSGHVSEIRKVWRAIWNDWVPQSGLKPMQGPELERYGKAFNPATGHGGFEIWVPVDR